MGRMKEQLLELAEAGLCEVTCQRCGDYMEIEDVQEGKVYCPYCEHVLEKELAA